MQSRGPVVSKPDLRRSDPGSFLEREGFEFLFLFFEGSNKETAG